MSDFWQQLRDPRWQKKRLEILQRDGWACVDCDESESELHVHHLRYVTGKKPWEYADEDLRTLCKTCHKDTTSITRESRDRLYNMLAVDLCGTHDMMVSMSGAIAVGLAGTISEIASQAFFAVTEDSNEPMNDRMKRVHAELVKCLYAVNDIALEAQHAKNQDD